MNHRPAAALLISLSAMLASSGCQTSASSPHSHDEAATASDNKELLALYSADQADRTPGTTPDDWHKVQANDLQRETRVREMLDAGLVKSGRDYFHAAMVFQHASDPAGIQLAHELAMIGACLGNADSRWLAAASYDRLLMYLKVPQRFGTQYRTDEQGVMKLYEVGEGVTDPMRAALNVPPIAQAREREKEMQAQMEELRKSLNPTSSK